MRPLLLALVLAACGSATPSVVTHPPDAHHGPHGEILGPTSRAEIESELPAWRDAIAGTSFDRDAADHLATVAPGADVDVFLGTWCGDSRREISRVFRALAQAETHGALPFTIRFIGVDRAKTAPGFTESAGLRYVPTIVVRRGGVELGRIVESVPPSTSVERSLLGLLDGTLTGVISGRTDL